MRKRMVFFTPSDRDRLMRILASIKAFAPNNRFYLSGLQVALDEARLVPVREIPRHVVALNSRVRVTNLRSGKKAIYTLVFPKNANDGDEKVSVLTPMGRALLGHKAGDVVEYQAPGGTRRLKIEEVVSSHP